MSAPASTIAILLALLLVPFVGATWWQAGRRAWARYFSRSVGLAIPDGMERLLIPRIVRSVRASSLGAAVGEGATIGAAVLIPDQGRPELWLILGGYLSGGGIGAAIAALMPPRTLGADERRFARSAEVTLRDYLSPWERIGGRVVVILAAVAFVLGPVADPFGLWTGLPTGQRVVYGVMAMLAILTLALFELGARRILERGQPAGSSAELAWDDALRAFALRSLVTAPLCVGLWTVILIGATLLDAASAAPPRTPLWWAAEVGVLLALVALVAVVIAAIASRPQRYYLRRLWPEVLPTTTTRRAEATR
jgi:hypothetical protein